MRLRKSGYTVLVGVMAATAMAVVQSPQAAYADEPEVLVESNHVPGSVAGNGKLSLKNALDGSWEINNPGGTDPTKNVCVRAAKPIAKELCLGASDLETDKAAAQPDPITTSGYPGKPQGLPGASIDWIIDEAASMVAAEHGVRNDDLVKTYARPEIRAKVAGRLLNVLNRKLYGKTLTPREVEVYDALEAIHKQKQVDRAAWAQDRYTRWSKDPCTYVAPLPPAGSGLPVVANDALATKCGKTAALTQQFKFSNDTPSTEVFDVWAAYQHPTDSMSSAGSTAFQQMTLATIQALLANIGAVNALGASLTASLAEVSHVSTVASAEAASMIGVESAFTGTEVSAELAPSMSGLASDVVDAITAIVSGNVIGAAATYKLPGDSKPGKQIEARAKDVANQSDALGIVSRMDDYAGLDLEEQEEPANKPAAAIHSDAFLSGLVAQVTEWLIFSEAGDLIPDPLTIDQALIQPTAGDYRFLVNGTPVPQGYVQLYAPSGVAGRTGSPIAGYRVRLHRGWLMVAEVAPGGAVGPYAPRLSVGYVDPDGTPGQVTLINHVVGGGEPQIDFQLTESQPDDTLTSTVGPTWAFKQNAGESKTVTLETVRPVLPAINVLPSAEGDFIADHIITLRTNASTGTPTVGTTYTWTVDRLADDGTVAESIPVPPNVISFQHRYLKAGRYRARVEIAGTQTLPGDPPTPFAASGRVEFNVNQPEPELMTATIKDDRVLGGSLFLDLRLLQNTRDDDFTVEVEWANDGDGTPLTQTYQVHCQDTGFDTCDTGPIIGGTAEAPSSPSWTQNGIEKSPAFNIGPTENYLPFVKVTITNGYGQEIERAIPIVPGDERPRYDSDEVPTVEMLAGTGDSEYTVDVAQVHPATLVPPGQSQDLTLQPYYGTIIDQLPAGVRPDLVQKGNGEWWLQLKGSPSIDSVGTHPFFFGFEQEPIGSGLRPPPAKVLLEVKAATAPGYRAVLRGVPARFTDTFYRNRFPDWTVQVAQALAPGQTTFTNYSGTVMCRLESGPRTFFDKACTPDKQFPWPAERLTDPTLKATVYLIDNPDISADGPYVASLATRFVDPVVTSATPPATALSRLFQLKIHDNQIISAPYAGYAVACSEDGKAYKACFSNGNLALLRSPGSHTLRVKAVRTNEVGTPTTITTVPWVVTLPKQVLKLRIAASKRRGTRTAVTGALLLPQETYRISIGGKLAGTGKATNTGTFRRYVVVPRKLKPGRYKVLVTGANVGRQAVGTIRVRR